MSSVRPSRVWLVIAGGLFVVSLLPSYLLGRVAVHSVHVPVTAGQTFPLGKARLAIYVDRARLVSGTTCHIEAADSAGPGPGVAVVREHARFSITENGQRWYRVGTTPRVHNYSDWSVNCTQNGRDVPYTAMGYSQAPQLKHFVLALIAAIAIPAVCLVLAILLTIVVLLMRARSRRLLAQQDWTSS